MDRLNWRCDICGLVITSQVGNLRRHIALHGPWVLRYKCVTCGQKCSNKFNFKVHCLRHHKVVEEEDAMLLATFVVDYARGTLDIIFIRDNGDN